MNLEFILPFFKKNKDFFSEYQKYQITLADERKLFFIEEFQLKKKKCSRNYSIRKSPFCNPSWNHGSDNHRKFPEQLSERLMITGCSQATKVTPH